MDQQREELYEEAFRLLERANELLDYARDRHEQCEAHARIIYAALIARHGPDNMEMRADVARRAARVYAGGDV